MLFWNGSLQDEHQLEPAAAAGPEMQQPQLTSVCQPANLTCILCCFALISCRMSISWSRLLPQGVKGSSPSSEGIKWYRAVFKELKDNGIEPAVTLYHWDMPQVGACCCCVTQPDVRRLQSPDASAEPALQYQ
jgi:hypothetical protein